MKSYSLSSSLRIASILPGLAAGSQEKVKVPDQENKPWHTSVPPRILPGKRTNRIQQVFNKDTKRSADDGKKQPIGNTQQLHLLILRQHLAEGNARNGKHKANLNIKPD